MAIEIEALRSFVADLLANKGDTDPVGDEDPLLTSGRLASIDVLQIVLYLENNCGIDFASSDFDQDRFETIGGLARFAEGCAVG